MKQRWKTISSIPNKYNEKGEKLCLNCEKPITGRRKRYCSERCAYEFSSRFLSQTAFKEMIIKKRGYRCEKCGKETKELIFDHIVPIELGGEIFSENNVQLLCYECNRKKTSNDLKFIKEHKRIQKITKGLKKLNEFCPKCNKEDVGSYWTKPLHQCLYCHTFWKD